MNISDWLQLLTMLVTATAGGGAGAWAGVRLAIRAEVEPVRTVAGIAKERANEAHQRADAAHRRLDAAILGK